MKKLKLFLWLVVVCYFLYVLIRNGPAAETIGILAAALFAGIMQLWLHSSVRKRWREKQENKKKK